MLPWSPIGFTTSPPISVLKEGSIEGAPETLGTQLRRQVSLIAKGVTVQMDLQKKTRTGGGRRRRRTTNNHAIINNKSKKKPKRCQDQLSPQQESKFWCNQQIHHQNIQPSTNQTTIPPQHLRTSLFTKSSKNTPIFLSPIPTIHHPHLMRNSWQLFQHSQCSILQRLPRLEPAGVDWGHGDWVCDAHISDRCPVRIQWNKQSGDANTGTVPCRPKTYVIYIYSWLIRGLYLNHLLGNLPPIYLHPGIPPTPGLL